MSITLKIGANNSQLNSVLAQSQQMVGRFAGKLSVGFGSILKGTLAVDLFHAAVSKLEEPFHKLSAAWEKGSDLSKLSSRTGVAIPALMQLGKAFQHAGIEGDKLGPSINKMQKAIAGVNEEGIPTNKTFEQLGLSMASLQGMDAARQMQAIGSAIAGIADPAQRSLAAMSIFGKSGGEMLQLFENPEAMGDIGKSLGKQAEIMARSAEMFHRITNALGDVGGKLANGFGFWTGMAEKIGPLLLPVLEKMKAFDFTELGAEVGNAVAYMVSVFKDGKIGHLIMLSMQAGIESFPIILRNCYNAVYEMIGQAMGAMAEPSFWNALLYGFTAVVNKMGAALPTAFSGPLKSISDSIAYLFEKIQAGPGGEAKAGQAAALDASIAKMKAIRDENAASEKAARARGDDESANDWHREVVTNGKEIMDLTGRRNGLGMVPRTYDQIAASNPAPFAGQAGEMNKIGDQYGKDAAAEARKLAGTGVFNIGEIVKQLTANLGDSPALKRLAEEVSKFAGAFPSADAGHGKAGAMGGALGNVQPGVITSSLAKIGGGGNVAGGSAVNLQQAANALLQKLVTNTTPKPAGISPGGAGRTSWQ